MNEFRSMDAERVIEILNRRTTIPDEDCTFEEINVAINMAIYAVRKEIPMKPTHEATIYKCNTCPTCKQVIDTNACEELMGKKYRVRYRRCHFCGQSIDWSKAE